MSMYNAKFIIKSVLNTEILTGDDLIRLVMI